MANSADRGEHSLRYSAFISYNHKNRVWAGWLLKQLERYSIPPRLRGRETLFGVLGARLPPVFQDREELAASADLAQSVKDALSQSSSLIVICSPDAARSRWVNEEIRQFVALGRRDRIQLFVVDGEATQNDQPDSSFPPALFESDGREPLAVDVRPEADGKRAALLKVIAGILGVGYDELRQREQARRQRRLTLIAGGSAVGFVAMSALAVFAFVSRNEAVMQRDIARQQKMTAERTVEFVKSLFEISDPSEAQGKKVTAQEILDKGSARISNALKEEPTVKAQLMTTLSQVYVGLGSYRRGDQIIRDSLRLNVSDREVRARQLLAYANLQFLQGQYRDAIRINQQALALLRGEEGEWRELEASILIGLGEAKSAMEDFAGAKRDIMAALRIDMDMTGKASPAVARDLETLGHNYLAEGEFAKARPLFERALSIRIPAQGMAHPRVSEDLNELGSIAYLQRDSASAERYWQRALASDELVLGPEHPDLAITINNVARVMLERRDFASAKPLLLRAAAISLRQRGEMHDDLAFTLANLALAERGLGDTRAAEDELRKAVVVAQAHKHRNLAPIMTELADLLCGRRILDEALALLDQAEPIMKADYPDDPWRAAWVSNTKGFCLVRANKIDQGRRLLLASMGKIRERWKPDSLFGHLAEQRLRQVSGFAGR